MTWHEFKVEVERQLMERFPQFESIDDIQIGIIQIDFRPSAEREGNGPYLFLGVTSREQGDGDEFNLTNGIVMA